MKKKSLSDFGVIGLAVMGSNLARNVESRGFSVSLYNRSYEKTEEFMGEFGDGQFTSTKNIKAFVQSIKAPRKIMIMVKAGGAVDAVIASLLPHIKKGDVIIDGGNSFYKDTQKRFEQLKEKGIHYVGCGVSGGEEGALHGPSLMLGGSKAGWKSIKNIMESIAA